ncbi:Cytochrome P450 hydroxylase [Oceanicola granulosus HTCC2516]|uniref:Cytochrome P450 hydroxylase n=1 Tax=Oceanicola granulosus (strain ATCC BAA-861 / DSM 15982 / KCTC 12143 / HTCC2516) TaxID=314256 RepID=Q2CG31_OCEGH|nr:cytochrome P450 [Oceanicola granulosus]EAR51698.1 Cytochrome P450 hydroxylase [Oceanicola granulosus HTCC2516]
MLHLSQDPTEPSFVQDPYPFYERARAGGDLFHWEEYGLCAVSHRAVMALLKDRRLGREIPAEAAEAIPERLRPFYDIEADSMLELEPPRHTRLRGLVLRAFTSRRIAALEADIEALCRGLVADFPDGPFDLLDAFARPLPVIVIARLLGVPEARATDLLAWSNAMVGMYQARRTREMEDAAVAASVAFRDFVEETVAARRQAPGPDLLSELIAVEREGARLTTDELVATVILLLNAGHEATVHSLGNAVRLLLAEGVREVDAAVVEECLRLDPPLHLFSRWVYEEVELFGHRFARGDQVNCLLAAANRDPAAYPEPDAFRPGRSGPQSAAFGGGIHFCVGAPLARLEMAVALRVLFETCPGLHAAEPSGYADVFHFHGLERLMVAR